MSKSNIIYCILCCSRRGFNICREGLNSILENIVFPTSEVYLKIKTMFFILAFNPLANIIGKKC